MSRIVLEIPEPPLSITVTAVYIGKDYPNLIKGQQYKLTLTYHYETTYKLVTNKDKEELTVSGLIDFVKNFSQICYLK